MSFNESDFKYTYNNCEVTGRLIVSTIIALEQAGMHTESFYNHATSGHEFDIRFSINGHEIPAKLFLERYEQTFEEDVEATAKRMLLDRFEGLDDRFKEASENIEKQLQKALAFERSVVARSDADIADVVKALEKMLRDGKMERVLEILQLLRVVIDAEFLPSEEKSELIGLLDLFRSSLYSEFVATPPG